MGSGRCAAIYILIVLVTPYAWCVDPDTASVRLGIYVPPIVQWLDGPPEGASAAAVFVLPPAPDDGSPAESSYTFRLMMNVDVVVQASVTPFRERGPHGRTLATLWRVTDDTDGAAARTGVAPKDQHAHEGYGALVPTRAFIPDGLHVTHFPSDGAVRITVAARATRPAGVDGVFEASVTLTAVPQTWVAFGGPAPTRRPVLPRYMSR